MNRLFALAIIANILSSQEKKAISFSSVSRKPNVSFVPFVMSLLNTVSFLFQVLDIYTFIYFLCSTLYLIINVFQVVLGGNMPFV